VMGETSGSSQWVGGLAILGLWGAGMWWLARDRGVSVFDGAKQPKPRSWVAQSAYRTGGGAHQDKRKKRQGTRKQRRDRAAWEG
jgi:hypothetical protein